MSCVVYSHHKVTILWRWSWTCVYLYLLCIYWVGGEVAAFLVLVSCVASRFSHQLEQNIFFFVYYMFSWGQSILINWLLEVSVGREGASCLTCLWWRWDVWVAELSCSLWLVWSECAAVPIDTMVCSTLLTVWGGVGCSEEENWLFQLMPWHCSKCCILCTMGSDVAVVYVAFFVPRDQSLL